ncbi:MAG: pseudouridine synthase [Pirellulaceae bacterium]|nr:pseudouridine synthase [Pirellulaceae bacterium]
MTSFVNVAAYQFAALDNLPELRAALRELAQAERLRGTILLAQEGINLFVAGSAAGVELLLARVRAVPGLERLEAKISYSREQPFRRMLVKIKREIIPFGVPGIDPRRSTAPRLPASELKRWLDERRPVVLLDTRNDFEVEAGTFVGAVPIGIDDFREFPAAAERLPAEMKSRPVVTFCTGGIRCEKASALLMQQGFTDVYQLDGGILKYFEECRDAHYQGDCFVFDQRVALDANLREANLRQCYACQAILTADEFNSPQFAEGQSCPRCYVDADSARQELLAARHAAIRAATSPLPGSMAYDNLRPISVPLRLDGAELLDFLDAMRTHLSREEWLAAAREGRLTCRDEVVLPGRTMRAGERLLHRMPAAREPDVSAGIEILDEDSSLVVVNKPAPLPMHPCGRFCRNTLSYILGQVYDGIQLRPAHRLDADTSGVVVLSKSRDVARRVQPQFETGRVQKTYLALVEGWPEQDAWDCHAPLQLAPGPGGLRLPEESGGAAETSFRVLARRADGRALVEVVPRSGRTNQIRAHLWLAGHPVAGDPAYLPGRKVGEMKTLSPGDPPLGLHAHTLTLTHPQTGSDVTYTAPPPEWAQAK